MAPLVSPSHRACWLRLLSLLDPGHAHPAAVDPTNQVGASASAEGSASGAVVLCGSAASAAIGLVEDRYSTSLKTLDSFQRACPARSQRLEAARCEGSSDVCLLMAVADSIAQEQVLKHSGYQGALAITGSPQFDETIRRRSEGGSGQAAAQMWLARERAAVRVRLGVGGRDFVLLLAGQPVGDDEVLQLVVDGLKEAALLQRVWVLHRSHPRQSADELAAYRRVQEAAPAEWFQVATKTMEAFHSSEELIAGMDVVVSGYSSTNYYAMLAGVPGVLFADVPKVTAKFRADKRLETVPEVAAGAGWLVSSGTELAHAVQAALEGSPEAIAMRERQAQLCRFHDGGAAARVWGRLRGAAAARRARTGPRSAAAGQRRRSMASATWRSR
mmetsp:Transcript_62/g.106  ORF Transcript_62/g.106 Transcript_62/m.106 type:complete len:387 (-) Transcript_62:468-1628(-)